MLTLFWDLIDADGDKERFAHIFNQYNSYLFHYIQTFVSEKQDIEDILQETFLTVARIIARIDDSDEKKLKSFLKTIARNNALTHLEKKKKRMEHEEPLIDDGVYGDERTYIDEVINNVSMEQLVKKIKELDRSYRDILLLHYVYDKSIREISEILHITADAARKRLGRAVKRLGDSISKEGYL